MLRSLLLISLAAPSVALAGPGLPQSSEGGEVVMAATPTAPRARVIHLGEALKVTRRIRTEATRVHLASVGPQDEAAVTVVRGFGASEGADEAEPELWQALASLCGPADADDEARVAVPVRLDF
jgi:hypothetical protein